MLETERKKKGRAEVVTISSEPGSSPVSCQIKPLPLGSIWACEPWTSQTQTFSKPKINSMGDDYDIAIPRKKLKLKGKPSSGSGITKSKSKTKSSKKQGSPKPKSAKRTSSPTPPPPPPPPPPRNNKTEAEQRFEEMKKQRVFMFCDFLVTQY